MANKLKVALDAYGFEVVTTRPKISDDPSIADYFGQKKANTPTATEKPSTTTNTKLYRVQTGAFSVKKYADAHLNKIKAAGFEAYNGKGG